MKRIQKLKNDILKSDIIQSIVCTLYEIRKIETPKPGQFFLGKDSDPTYDNWLALVLFLYTTQYSEHFQNIYFINFNVFDKNKEKCIEHLELRLLSLRTYYEVSFH